MPRCSFTFGQLEELLVVMHRIADAHRGAFRGRLKHLQRWGFPTGKNPGKGKAIKYTIEDIFRAVLAIELIQAGLNPKLAVDIVNRNWESLQSSVYLNTFSRIERAEHWPEEDYDDWCWLVRPEALLSLTEQGEGKYDNYEAIVPVRSSELDKFLTLDAIGFSPVLGAHWRNLVIHGGPLVRGVTFLIEVRFGWATQEEMRADLGDAAAEHGARLKTLFSQAGEIFGPVNEKLLRKRITVSQRYSVDQVAAAQACLDELPDDARVSFSTLTDGTIKVPMVLVQTLIAARLATIEMEGITFTELGEVVIDLLREDSGEGNSDDCNTQT